LLLNTSIVLQLQDPFGVELQTKEPMDQDANNSMPSPQAQVTQFRFVMQIIIIWMGCLTIELLEKVDNILQIK
jgi:hypothetical protein